VSLRQTIVIAMLAVVALAACGDDDTGPVVERPGDSGIEHPTGADDLVLQVHTAGGLAAPPLAAIPELSVYGDGRVIGVGPTTLEYPGAALPNLQQGFLSERELQEVLRAAGAAGLLGEEEPDYGDPGVTDMPTTEVVINAGGVERDVSAYALDFVDGDDDLEPAQQEARRRLRDFLRAVDADVATEGYEAESVAVFVRPFDVDETGDSSAETREWPLGDLAGAGEPAFGTGDIRCLVVEGADAQTVLVAADEAGADDRWRSGDAEYSIDFRPLLPDESGCDDLVPAQTAGA
jgi:hypothetical protein